MSFALPGNGFTHHSLATYSGGFQTRPNVNRGSTSRASAAFLPISANASRAIVHSALLASGGYLRDGHHHRHGALTVPRNRTTSTASSSSNRLLFSTMRGGCRFEPAARAAAITALRRRRSYDCSYHPNYFRLQSSERRERPLQSSSPRAVGKQKWRGLSCVPANSEFSAHSRKPGRAASPVQRHTERFHHCQMLWLREHFTGQQGAGNALITCLPRWVFNTSLLRKLHRFHDQRHLPLSDVFTMFYRRRASGAVKP